jgi:hypothetical protein
MVRTSDVNPITLNEFDKATVGADLAGKKDELIHVTTAIFKAKTNRSPPWAVKEIVYNAGKTKDAFLSGGRTTQMTDGKAVVERTDYNKRIQVSHPGLQNEHMVSLDEFRYIPAETATFRLVGRQSGVTELEKDGGVKSLVRVDEGTGVVLRHVMVGGDGVPIRCVIQYNVVTYPGGVAFPTLAVSGMFGPDGRLRSASLRGRLESGLPSGPGPRLPSWHDHRTAAIPE